MLHFHYFYLHASDAEAFGYGFPLPVLNFFQEIGRPNFMYISVDIGYEVSVGVADDVVFCLGGKHEEGVVCIEDILSVCDDEGAGVGHEHVVLFGNFLIEDYAQE